MSGREEQQLLEDCHVFRTAEGKRLAPDPLDAPDAADCLDAPPTPASLDPLDTPDSLDTPASLDAPDPPASPASLDAPASLDPLDALDSRSCCFLMCQTSETFRCKVPRTPDGPLLSRDWWIPVRPSDPTLSLRNFLLSHLLVGPLAFL